MLRAPARRPLPGIESLRERSYTTLIADYWVLVRLAPVAVDRGGRFADMAARAVLLQHHRLLL